MTRHQHGRRISRRDLFQRGGELAVAATALAGVGGFPSTARAQSTRKGIPRGDRDILRFLAAAEILETDLWEQYCELAEDNPAYREALESIDDEMPEYICDNTTDEQSHAAFLNAYLASVGADPVDLEPFRTLTPPDVEGLEQRPRLTNLTNLNVDTSWVNRYLGSGNPDFGDTFDQILDIENRAAIPTSNSMEESQILAAAYVAAFHFGAIEQGGTSIYPHMLSRAQSRDAIKILAAIGPTEAWHLTVWRDQIGGIRALDAGGGLVFPNLEEFGEHIMPNPCTFFDRALPLCSVVRPMDKAGAVAAANFLTDSGLFAGQSQAFFDALDALARAADAAGRA